MSEAEVELVVGVLLTGAAIIHLLPFPGFDRFLRSAQVIGPVAAKLRPEAI